MQILTIELPYPPLSGNNMYGHRKGGKGRFLRKPVAKWKEVCIGLAMCAAMRAGHETITGRVAVSMDIYPPDRRRRDWDNVQKAVWDSLTKAKIYEDDSQVKSSSVRVLDPEAGGKLVVTVREA